MNSVNKIARTAGLFYLLYVITSIIANLFGKFVFVDAPVTVDHIMTHAFQFRIGFVVNLFSVVFFLIAAWALYVLLKPVNKDLALLFLLFNLAGFVVWLFSSLCLFASLLILNGTETIKVFQPDQLQALAVFFVNLYKNGSFIAQVPYGVWLFLKMSSKVDSRHFCTVPIVEIRRRRFALTHLTLRVSPARNSSWGDH